MTTKNFNIVEHNRNTDNPYVRQANNAAKRDAKVQIARKPTGKIFSPTRNFRTEHFSAQLTKENPVRELKPYLASHTMVLQLGISLFTAELLYKRLYS